MRTTNRKQTKVHIDDKSSHFIKEVFGRLEEGGTKVDKQEAFIEFSVYNVIRGNPAFLAVYNNMFNILDDGRSYSYQLEIEQGIPLLDYLRSKNAKPKEVILSFMKLLDELQWMNANGIYYADFKPDNVVVINDLFYLVDFGRCVTKRFGSISHGAYEFIAPEVYYGEKHSESSQVYSIMLMLYWILNKCTSPFLVRPYNYSEMCEAFKRRINGVSIPPIPSLCTKINSVLLKCINGDAESRLNRFGLVKTLLNNALS